MSDLREVRASHFASGFDPMFAAQSEDATHLMQSQRAGFHKSNGQPEPT